ncbi:hypothetical protein LWI29_010172 [Acer saccharum]|uniref:Uncharacterized protein n=1 Tax=Acer saccharum TaxID=4024 RepID=A0AA39SRT9_ACESA|nr:hypothetical protein LWI29_010172 [Acer saccharum]
MYNLPDPPQPYATEPKYINKVSVSTQKISLFQSNNRYSKTKALAKDAAARHLTTIRSFSHKLATRPVSSLVPSSPFIFSIHSSVFAMAILGVVLPSSSPEVGRSNSEIEGGGLFWPSKERLAFSTKSKEVDCSGHEGAANPVSMDFSKQRSAVEEEQ